MNDSLKKRLLTLEQQLEEEDKSPIYRWDDGSLSRAELLKMIPPDALNRVIIFSWRLTSDAPFANKGRKPGNGMDLLGEDCQGSGLLE